MLLVAWLFASIFVFSKSALLSWWDARWNERAIAELEGKQVQRHVDASTVTHQPYRYLFDKCLDPWAVHHADGVTYLGCRGNVRILAGDDTVLGRGDTAIFKGKGGADVAHAVIFGDWRDTFDEADLRAK